MERNLSQTYRDSMGQGADSVPLSIESDSQLILYASVTSLDCIRLPNSYNPAPTLHLGAGVWGAEGGNYHRVDGDLLAWMAGVLDRQAEDGSADPDCHARSVEFLNDLVGFAESHGISPSASVPDGYRLRLDPPRYHCSFLTK